MDNGPELISRTLVNWCEEHQVELGYNQRSKPNQNEFIERFNKTYWVKVLNAILIQSLDQASQITEE